MNININNKTLKVKTLITSRDTQKGMMGRLFDSNFDGLLFIMSESKNCFWMKNCIVDLDIIFINDNKISKIHHRCKPCVTEECEHYCGFGNIILELPGGYCKKRDIREGDVVTY